MLIVMIGMHDNGKMGEVYPYRSELKYRFAVPIAIGIWERYVKTCGEDWEKTRGSEKGKTREGERESGRRREMINVVRPEGAVKFNPTQSTAARWVSRESKSRTP